jgi:hypothetical protein
VTDDKRRPKRTPAVVRSEGYLIFRIQDGRLEDCGLYETYEAAKARMASAGLSTDWKIAPITCWLRERPRGQGKKFG